MKAKYNQLVDKARKIEHDLKEKETKIRKEREMTP